MDELKDLLKTSIVTVKFKKVNGIDRTMLCTLVENFLPKLENKSELGYNTKIKNEDIFTVFDLEKQAWRAFRLDSVIEYFV